MTRAVLDTNVLASGAVASPGTTLARIIDAMGQGSFELVVSEVILIELRRTLANPYYAGRSHSYSADQPAARPLPSWHPFQPCRACPEPHDNPRTGRLQPFLSNRAGDPGRAAGRRGHRAGDPGEEWLQPASARIIVRLRASPARLKRVPAGKRPGSWLVRRVRVTTPCVVRICQGPAQLDEDDLGDDELEAALPHCVDDAGEGRARAGDSTGGKDVGVQDGTGHSLVRACFSRSARICARTSATMRLVSCSISSGGTSLNASCIRASARSNSARCWSSRVSSSRSRAETMAATGMPDRSTSTRVSPRYTVLSSCGSCCRASDALTVLFIGSARSVMSPLPLLYGLVHDRTINRRMQAAKLPTPSQFLTS